MLQPKVYIKSLDIVLPVDEIDFNIDVIKVSPDNARDFEQFDFDEVEFIENTGFKDKHGNYVYVGSILTDEGELGEDERIYGIVTKDIDEGCYISWKLIEFSESLYECSAYSIVGNIYKNKELLKNE